MNAASKSTLGVNGIAPSYESVAADVALILRRRYKLTVKQANEAVQASPLRSLFQSDPVMAAHTSNETWAREVLAYWSGNTDC